MTIIAWLYIVVGAGGAIEHLTRAHLRPFEYDVIGIVVVSILAVVAGIWMLRGADWARWLALLWMAFHVGISFLDGWSKVAIHSAMLAVIAFFLLRRTATEWFRSSRSGPFA